MKQAILSLLLAIMPTIALAQSAGTTGSGFPLAGGIAIAPTSPDYLTASDFSPYIQTAQKINPIFPIIGLASSSTHLYNLNLGIVPLTLGGTGCDNQQDATNAILNFPNCLDGSLLQRSNSGWKPLAGGKDGQALTMLLGHPAWSDSTVAIPRTAHMLVTAPESQIPNSSILSPIDGGGITLSTSEGKTNISADATVARTNVAERINSPWVFSEDLSCSAFHVGSCSVTPTDKCQLLLNNSKIVTENADRNLAGDTTLDNLFVNGMSITVHGYNQIFPAASDTLANLNSQQCLANKSLMGAGIVNAPPYLKFLNSGGDYTIKSVDPTGDRIYQFYDANTDGDIAIKQGKPIAGGVAYGDGNCIQFSQGGATGMPLVSNGNAPAYQPLGIEGGGTGVVQYSPGDLLFCGPNGKLTTLPIGQSGQVLKVSPKNLPVWSN